MSCVPRLSSVRCCDLALCSGATNEPFQRLTKCCAFAASDSPTTAPSRPPWRLIASGIEGDAGCALLTPEEQLAINPNYRTNVNTLAACQVHCAGKPFLQYHLDNNCACRDSCPLTRLANTYFSKANVYKANDTEPGDPPSPMLASPIGYSASS